jgi:hypothetical protein
MLEAVAALVVWAFMAFCILAIIAVVWPSPKA